MIGIIKCIIKIKTNRIKNNVNKADKPFGILNFPIFILLSLFTRGFPINDKPNDIRM